MDKGEVETRVKQVTARVLSVDPDDVANSADFGADLGAESVQSIELIAAFEEEFKIEMDEDAAMAIDNVGAAIDFIHQHVVKQHGG